MSKMNRYLVKMGVKKSPMSMVLPYLSFGAGAALGVAGVLLFPRLKSLLLERAEHYEHGNGGSHESEYGQESRS